MENSINVGVIGSSGYTGIELVKILNSHRNVFLKELTSQTHKNINELFSNLNNKNLTLFKKKEEIDVRKLDLVFIALPHSESQDYISKIIDKVKIIDLSGDFRLKNIKDYYKWYKQDHSIKDRIQDFVYGLTEIYKNKIINAVNIAVPGCYPTSVLLPLIPLLNHNIVNEKNIIIDSKSGYSGAGKNFNLKKLINNNIYNFYSYKTNNHRHIPEIEQELSFSIQKKVNIIFNPHILPIERGIISTIYCNLINNIESKEIENFLINFYKDDKFIEITQDNKDITLYDVIGTNKCIIKIIKNDLNNSIIIQSIIDNLIKGASGQAVQNMNLMFKFNEYEALEMKKIVDDV